MDITAEEFLAALHRDWPMQYELTLLREANRRLITRVAELEAIVARTEACGDGDSTRPTDHADESVA